MSIKVSKVRADVDAFAAGCRIYLPGSLFPRMSHHCV